ncbi:regulatory protein LacI (plasmid) [Gemmatirosa kalamazoonensis]|uniref:Regulatory protein LacI n=1 Tax=Gemmatirosa kalamazoonensis TaxID=861299 RepID=W0RTJ8_9BACT|nr:regulatory protein LacI [Gemmatirosa kalamazoonensis]
MPAGNFVQPFAISWTRPSYSAEIQGVMVGLKDVGRMAGVSVSTVSRVLTGSSLVNDATRERVQRAIDALGYQPSRVARRLRKDPARANLIGLVVPDIENPFFADVVRGVEDVAQRHDYMLFLGNADEDARRETHYLELMRAESVDGVIVPASAEAEPLVARLAAAGLPIVCVDRRMPSLAVDTVVADNVRGAAEAVEHLLDVGHRRIGFVGGRPDLSTSRERYEGYQRALAERDVAVDPSLVRFGDSRQESGRRLTRELLAQREPPTAILVGNNLMTLGALEAIHVLRRRIPDDIAVIGYDDMPWALALNPPLTAVRQPGYEMGRCAAELLLKRIEAPARPTTVRTLRPTLVVRESCGARRGGPPEEGRGERPRRRMPLLDAARADAARDLVGLAVTAATAMTVVTA